MRLLTDDECGEWLSGRGRELLTPGRASFSVPYPRQLYPLAQLLATTTTFQEPSLLWITEWGIWSGSDNLHLYYRLRHSYGDQRLLEDAPGHLFLGFETADLASFLHLAMLNGWDGYLLTHLDYVNCSFSHDGFLECYAEEAANLEDLRQQLSDDS